MTRKDYELIAKVLKRLNDDFNNGGSDEVSLSLITAELATAFVWDNPRFDSVRFVKAIHGAKEAN